MPGDWTAVFLQSAAALAAGYATWRCINLQKYGTDPRLRRLGWFFGLFAVSMVFAAAWSFQISSFDLRPPLNGSRGLREGLARPQGVEGVTWFLVLQHTTMIAALGVAVRAFGRKRPAAAAALMPLALFGSLIPLLLAAEAALTLYLAVHALMNHVERKSPGALQVALGFSLFFLGHLLFFLQHQPATSRQAVGDILALVGIVLLVQMLPGRR